MAFSDGTPLTAQAFAYSFDRALDPNLCSVDDVKSYPPDTGLCSPLAYTGAETGYLGHIVGAVDRNSGASPTVIGSATGRETGVTVVDPLTLEVRIDKPVQFFLDTMTFTTTSAVEQKLVADPRYAGGLWVRHLDSGGCSGPFMVQSYGGGSQLTLVPNPNWEKAWGQHLTLSAVVRPAIGVLENEYANYDRQGEYDYTDVPLDDYGFASSQADFHELASLETDYFGMNFRQAPFDIQQMRQAFDLALNKQYIVDTIEGGGAIPTNHIIPKGMPGFDADLHNPSPDSTQSITGSTSAAQAALKSAQATCAGWTGGPNPPHDWCPYIVGSSLKEIDVYVQVTNQTRVRVAADAVAEWSSVLGLNVQSKPVAAMYREVYGVDSSGQSTNVYQAWVAGWVADYPDAQDWTTLQFAVGAPYNAGFWNVPGLDTLLAKADVDTNQTQRLSEYNQAEQLIINSCAWIPFQQEKESWRIRTTNTREVLGFTYDTLDLVPQLSWPQVEIWVPGTQ
jgi:peptide/nickel transport system substrate-binding protein/oligopeptide transport system substrate-binding protein